MALKNLGKLPGERKLVVNSAAGPTCYTPGTGIQVRMDFKTLPNIYGIVGVWLYPIPKYAYCVGGWAGNVVNVLLGCPSGASCLEPSCFNELPSCTDVSDVSAFVAAMGR